MDSVASIYITRNNHNTPLNYLVAELLFYDSILHFIVLTCGERERTFWVFSRRGEKKVMLLCSRFRRSQKVHSTFHSQKTFLSNKNLSTFFEWKEVTQFQVRIDSISWEHVYVKLRTIKVIKIWPQTILDWEVVGSNFA